MRVAPVSRKAATDVRVPSSRICPSAHIADRRDPMGLSTLGLRRDGRISATGIRRRSLRRVEPPQLDRVAGRWTSTSSGTTASASAAASATGRGSPAPPAHETAGRGRDRLRPERARRPNRAPRSRAGRRAGSSRFAASSSRTARSTGRSRSRRPSSARIAGRTNSSNVTKLDTGLPGRPNRSVRPPSGRVAVPNAKGLPGWTATRHRPISPIASNASFTTSYGPTDTPPATTIASAPWSSADRSRDDDVVELVGGDPERDRLGAGRLDEGAEARAVRVGDSGGPEVLARGSAPRCPSRGRRRAAGGARRRTRHPRRPRAPPRPGSSPSPGARISSPAAEVAAAAGGCARPARRPRGRGSPPAPGRRRRARARPGVPVGVERVSSARPGRPRRHRPGSARPVAMRIALPGSTRAIRHAAGRNLAGDVEPRRRLLGRTRDIGRADGVAIHRRVVPRRQRHGRDDRPRQHAPAAPRPPARPPPAAGRGPRRGSRRVPPRRCSSRSAAAVTSGALALRRAQGRHPRPAACRPWPRPLPGAAALLRPNEERRGAPREHPNQPAVVHDGQAVEPLPLDLLEGVLERVLERQERELRGLDHRLLDPGARPARLRDPANLRDAEDPDDLVALDDRDGRHRRLAIDELGGERVDRQARADRDRVGLHRLVRPYARRRARRP